MKLPLYKNGISKIVNLLDPTSDDKDLPRFVTIKRIEGNCPIRKKIALSTKKLESKHKC